MPPSMPFSQRPAPQAGPATAMPRTASAPSGGFDQQALQRIEEIRRKHMKLRDIQVRAQADAERFGAEEKEAMAAIREQFGKESIDDLRTAVLAMRAEATRIIEDYAGRVNEVEEHLKTLGETV